MGFQEGYVATFLLQTLQAAAESREGFLWGLDAVGNTDSDAGLAEFLLVDLGGPQETSNSRGEPERVEVTIVLLFADLQVVEQVNVDEAAIVDLKEVLMETQSRHSVDILV